MKVNPKCCYLLQVTLRPRETESLSDFLLISVGLDMGSQTVLQDGKCCSRDLLHLGYLGNLEFFWNGAFIYWVFRTNPGTWERLLNDKKMITLNNNAEIGFIILETWLCQGILSQESSWGCTARDGELKRRTELAL